jgi:hypothetical protein
LFCEPLTLTESTAPIFTMLPSPLMSSAFADSMVSVLFAPLSAMLAQGPVKVKLPPLALTATYFSLPQSCVAFVTSA